jgi:hypothetical protein
MPVTLPVDLPRANMGTSSRPEAFWVAPTFKRRLLALSATPAKPPDLSAAANARSSLLDPSTTQGTRRRRAGVRPRPTQTKAWRLGPDPSSVAPRGDAHQRAATVAHSKRPNQVALRNAQSTQSKPSKTQSPSAQTQRPLKPILVQCRSHLEWPRIHPKLQGPS